MGIQSIIEAKKPCLIMASTLRDVVMGNLSFLAKDPLDIIRPDKFDIGLKNLCEYAKITITKRADHTYLIEDAK